MRKALINREKMEIKVKQMWAKLRYNVRQGIKRRRENPHEPLIRAELDDKPII